MSATSKGGAFISCAVCGSASLVAAPRTRPCRWACLPLSDDVLKGAGNRADVVRFLRSQIARMSRLDLAMSLFLLLGLFHGQNLRFRQHVAWLLCQFRFERLQPLGEGLQVMSARFRRPTLFLMIF